MVDLSVIPSPPKVKWREFCRRFLPGAVFLVALAAAILVARRVSITQGIAGVAEGIRSMVASPHVGLLQDVKVRPFEMVQAGQTLAILLPLDPRSQLDFVQAGVQLARMRHEPSVADQNAMNFEQINVDLLRLRRELAVAKVSLERADSVLRRNEVLFKKKLVSEDAYELSLKDRDVAQTEVVETTKAIAAIEQRLEVLRPLGVPGATNLPLNLLIVQLEKQLSNAETNWAPIILTAPISGMVHMIHRQPGEYVADGEYLLTIHSTRAQYIVGYMRQPYRVEPEIGMPVQVLTRSRQRRKFQSIVLQVGAQIDYITNAIAYMTRQALVDTGLPILIDVPPHVFIRPGEVVDLVFNAAGATTATEPGGTPRQREPALASHEK